MGQQYIIRLISSSDHRISKPELIELIGTTGTDRYDSNRKQIFNDFYKQHDVDFFGIPVNQSDLESRIISIKKEFRDKTVGDRNKEVLPDIAIVYDASSCNMIPSVYKDSVESDCFQFKTTAKEALVEVRPI